MAIYFDSGTGRGKGVEILVTDEKGTNLLPLIIPSQHITEDGTYLIPKKEATNNYGELLACYTALKIALKIKETAIFGDSQLVLHYWSKGHYNRKNLKNKDTINLINEVKNLREEFENVGGTIHKISGDSNPADLGFHK